MGKTMTIDFNGIFNLCIVGLYFLQPAYLSNSSAVIFGGGTPLDFGYKTKSGKDLIGKGCTWRGLIVGTIIGGITGLIQGIITPSIVGYFGGSLPLIDYGGAINGLIIGLLLGCGALLGDAVGSFIKRRLNVKQGKPAPILDQIDFAIGSLLLSSIMIKLDLKVIITILILSIILHVLTNITAYLVGIKDVWY